MLCRFISPCSVRKNAAICGRNTTLTSISQCFSLRELTTAGSGTSMYPRPKVSVGRGRGGDQTGRTWFPVEPGRVTSRRMVPSTIPYPEYAVHGQPRNSDGNENSFITFSDKEDLKKLRNSAQLARQMLDLACSLAKPGVTTEEIDIAIHNEIIRRGAYPSPINYRGFPKAICTSINEVICHGIPDNRKLLTGDIISIDVSIYFNGFHGDNCATVIVGGDEAGDDAGRNLVSATQDALSAAIEICKPGVCLSKIGEAIQSVAEAHNLRVVHEFMGHGTGPYLHMNPMVRHYRNKLTIPLVKGMVFTIEPILVEGSRRITVWDDGWTAVTVDGGRGAQFEHEILITDTGAQILTLP